MRLINVETRQLVNFFQGNVPAYAILSHTWGPDEEEITYQDLQAGNIKPGIGSFKLDESCKQAKKDGLLYIWNDTCCIDKTNSTELSESINSMFKWYRQADRCYAYLQDVPHDQLQLFPKSRWFTRGWTLQELLAPKGVDFFSSEWRPLGSRKELAPRVERATGIPQHYLMGIADVSEASVAQRMSWAAKRQTKRREDIAYSLLGLFGVSMSMIYGEGDEAFMRLQEEIMRRGSDDSILAWGLDSTGGLRSVNAGRGCLATHPSNFENCGVIVASELSTTSIDSFNTLGGNLSARLPLYKTPTGDVFGLLGSHLDDDHTRIVGIPLRSVGSHSPSTYVRPQNLAAKIFDRKDCLGATNASIKIRKDNTSQSPVSQRRHGFYIKDQTDLGLKIVRVHPHERWQQANETILAVLDPETGLVKTHRSWARLRAKGYTEDLVLILDLESPRDKSSAPTPKCSLMLSNMGRLSDWDDQAAASTNNAFENIKLPGSRHILMSGIRSVQANVVMERVGAQPMFVVKITTGKSEISSTEIPSWDVALRMVSIQNQMFVNIKGHDAAIAKQLHAKMRLEEMATEEKPLRTQLTDVEDQIRALEAERERIRSRLASHKIDIAAETQVHTSMTNKLRVFTSQQEVLQQEWEYVIRRRLHGPGNDSHLHWQLDVAGRLLDDLSADVEAAQGLSVQESAKLPERLLVRAVLHGNPGIATFAMKGLGATARSIMLQAQGERPKSLLEVAASRCSAAVVQTLLACESDPESEAALICSIAARHGNVDVVKAIYYSWPNLGTKILSLHLTQALEGTRHIPTVKLLLEKGADVNLPGSYPLHTAAKADDAAMFGLLLDSGACMTTANKNNFTPLDMAATYSADCTRILLHRGLKPHHGKSAEGLPMPSPICLAALGGQVEAVRLLLDAGADIEALSTNGRRPLSCAAELGHSEVVALLLDRGADPGADVDIQHNALYLAATRGHLETLRVICEHPASRNVFFSDVPAAAIKATRKANQHGIVDYLYSQHLRAQKSPTDAAELTTGSSPPTNTERRRPRSRSPLRDRRGDERQINQSETDNHLAENRFRQDMEDVRMGRARTDRDPGARPIIMDERGVPRGGRVGVGDMLPVNVNPWSTKEEQAKRPPSPPTRSTPVFKAFRAAMGRR